MKSYSLLSGTLLGQQDPHTLYFYNILIAFHILSFFNFFLEEWSQLSNQIGTQLNNC